jgi:ribosomal protein S18 acetylase RimI-like enzyme
VPFEATYSDGFRALVADTLPEFGFEVDPAFDSDLDDPAGAYTALWVAVEDGEVVGSVALRDLGGGVLELKRMYLRPSRRGLGLGKRLLGVALDYARAQDAVAVRLDTSEEMVAAQRLYEAHGFERVSGSAPRQGQCRLLYELRLG